MISTWNTWVEGPKSMDIENAIRKYCISRNVKINNLYSKDCNQSFFDKILGIKREVVYFNLEGETITLQQLQSELSKYEKYLNDDQILEKSAQYSEEHSKDVLQRSCLQQGYAGGYSDAQVESYNQAIDDILMKIAQKEIDLTCPPEALIYVFKKLKK